MEKILRVKDVSEQLNVSKATATRLIKRVVDAYKLDPSRMPIKGSVPAKIFIEFYQLDCSKEIEGIEDN